METPPSGTPPSGSDGVQGDLGDAIRALIARLTEVARGPEAHRVQAELEARVQDIVNQIDQTLDGPQAQALKERVASLIRSVQDHLR
jgi:hypothetical protein